MATLCIRISIEINVPVTVISAYDSYICEMRDLTVQTRLLNMITGNKPYATRNSAFSRSRTTDAMRRNDAREAAFKPLRERDLTFIGGEFLRSVSASYSEILFFFYRFDY